MRITVLASGSGGNATLFESGNARILVDAGIGPRTLVRCLGGRDRSIDAIVVTHQHRDHVGHAAVLARKRGIPVYLSHATARAVDLGDVEVRRFATRATFAIGPFAIRATPLPHDAAQVGLVIDDGTRRAVIATDLGEVTAALVDSLAGCDTLLVESNHDVDMLRRGPYPWSLKKRVASSRGHLSNAQLHTLLRALPPSITSVTLLHLSETNNSPQLARASARDALAGKSIDLHVAPPRGPLAIPKRGAPARAMRQLAFEF